MKKIARDKLDSRYSDIPHTILFASFLHPWTKNLVFLTEAVRTMTHNQVKIQMKNVIAVNETELESDTNDVESENKKQKLDNDVMDWL